MSLSITPVRRPKPLPGKHPHESVIISASSTPANRHPQSQRSVQHKPQKSHPKGASRAQSLEAREFLASVANPFNLPPPPLGFGTLSATGMLTGWNRISGITIGATATAFCASLIPKCVTYQSTLPWNATYASHFQFGSGNSGDYVSNLTNQQVAAPVNLSFIQSCADTLRPVTAGLKITVRYPMTSAPGRLFALPLYESTSALAILSPDRLADHPDSVPIVIDGSGVAVIEIKYIPRDVSDLDFVPSSQTAQLNADNASRLLVLGLGWAASTFSVDCDILVHYEYNAGALEAEPIVEVPSLALSVPMEVMGPMVRKIPLVTNKTGVVCEDLALKAAVARHGRGAMTGSSRSVMASLQLDASVGSGTVLPTRIEEVGYVDAALRNAAHFANSPAADMLVGGVAGGMPLAVARYLSELPR